MSQVAELTDSNFHAVVNKGIVVVDFWAPWCAPCRALAPILKELAVHYNDRITIAKINVDQHARIAAEYQIRSLPTILLFKEGEVVEKKVGLFSEQEFIEWLKSA